MLRRFFYGNLDMTKKNGMKVLGLVLLTMTLAGCSHEVLIQNSEGITLHGGVTQRDKIYANASAHCEKYGKEAILTLRDSLTYTFDCK